MVSYDNPEATAIMRRRGTVRELAKQLKIEEFEREAEDMLQVGDLADRGFAPHNVYMFVSGFA